MKSTKSGSYKPTEKNYRVAIDKIKFTIESLKSGQVKTSCLELNLQGLGAIRNRFFDHMLDLMDLSNALHYGMKIRGECLFFLISKKREIIDLFESIPDELETESFISTYRTIQKIID